MSVVTERLRIIIESTAGGAVKDIKATGAASEELSLKQQLLTKSSGLTQGALKSVGLQSVDTGTALKVGLAGGAIVAGAALAKFALDGVEKFASLTGEVRAFRRVSGATAEDSSKLVFAVKQLGIEPDAAAMAFGRLATRIGTGKANFDQFGVSVKKNKDGTVDLAGTVARLSDAYQNTASQTDKAALANEAFGRSWQTLSPLLGKSKEDLDALFKAAGTNHQIFSDDDLEKGRQFTASMNMLKSTLEGLKVEIGSALIPVVTQGTQAFTQGVQGADQLAGVLGTNLGGAVNFVNQSFNPLALSMHGVAAGSQLMQGNFGAAAGQFARSLPGIAGLTNAIFGSGEATNKFTEAQQRQQTAQTAVTEALANHGAKSKEARDATKELATATKELDGMTKGLGKSLNDAAYAADKEKFALAALTQVALGASGAHLSLAQAGNAAEAAHADVATKTDALAAAIRDYGEGSTEAASARRDLNQANVAAQSADLALTSATLNNDAANKALLDTYRGKIPALDRDIELLQQQQKEYPLAAAAIQPQIDQLMLVKWVLGTTPDAKAIKLTADVSDAVAQLDILTGKLDGIPGLAFVGAANNAVVRIAGQRAGGGPVMGGHAYLVNENTPRSELFVPKSDGWIVPSGSGLGGLTAPTMDYSRGGGAPTLVIPISNNTFFGVDDVKATVKEAIAEAARHDDLVAGMWGG